MGIEEKKIMGEIKGEEIKQQFDNMKAYSDGYKKGYGDALAWIADKMVKGEKPKDANTTVETNKDIASASK